MFVCCFVLKNEKQKGKLLGGLDVAKELAEDGSLVNIIPESNRKK